MCRNIKPLFNFDPPATEEEIYNASLQFVRKISGFQKPSFVNEKVFANAVDDVSRVTAELLKNLETDAPHKNRKEEAKKRKEKSEKRFGGNITSSSQKS